ncbi:MAG TPA: hypothetical protein VIX73_36335 [Kofleriaceae bacterium]
MSRAPAALLLGAGLVVTGCAPGARQEPPSNARAAAPGTENKMNGSVSPAGDKHPGQIVFDDRVENRTWTRTASEVSSAMAWVKVHDTWKPVVRIEITGGGDTREMTSFGPNHEFLETTTASLSGGAASSPSEPTPTPTPIPTPK